MPDFSTSPFPIMSLQPLLATITTISTDDGAYGNRRKLPYNPNQAELDVNLRCWAGDVGAPVVFVHRILLVDIKFEEFIVAVAFEIFVAKYHNRQ